MENEGHFRRLLLASVVLVAAMAATRCSARNTSSIPSKPLSVPAVSNSPRSNAASQTGAAGIEFVKISPGVFQMGCSASDSDCYERENPAHQVRITRRFEIGKYEVTQAQWRAVMETSPSYFKGDDLPVERVSWDDAQDFIARINAFDDGYRYRLPTEAEWEYAARAGSIGPYPGLLEEIGWYGNNAGNQYLDVAAVLETDKSNYGTRLLANGNRPHSVGKKQPNAWGLYDMTGNVNEWVGDWLSDYPSGLVSDPKGPAEGPNTIENDAEGPPMRILRGGSWYNYWRSARVSVRFHETPTARFNNDGFRVLREAIP